MLVSRFKSNKNNKTYISFIIDKKLVSDSKNPNYVRITLSEDWVVGLDNKKSTTMGKLINTKLVPINNK